MAGTLLLYARCTFGFLLFFIGSRTVRLGIASLPNGHPGRIYAEGRLGTGIERIGQVFCPKAAARHKTSCR